jgi:uncharacterized protein
MIMQWQQKLKRQMNNDDIIQKTVAYVKAELADAEGGHDWWHIYRVWRTAKEILLKEECDALTVELAALLHDIADSKFNGGDESIGPKKAEEFLKSIDVDAEITKHVVNIIKHMSFKSSHFEQGFTSKELMVVQDADRLDAIGAIGIARAFNYGGFKNRALFDPDVMPNANMTKEEYKNSAAPTINHFYEKLLLLKDRMNTETGKALAEKRHDFMVEYLEQFYREWEGKC